MKGDARPTALLAALGAIAVLAGACSSPDGKLENANALRHQGRPQEALAAYREILGELGDGTIPKWETGVRLKALQYAADISYLDLGDYLGAIALLPAHRLAPPGQRRRLEGARRHRRHLRPAARRPARRHHPVRDGRHRATRRTPPASSCSWPGSTSS